MRQGGSAEPDLSAEKSGGTNFIKSARSGSVCKMGQLIWLMSLMKD